MHAVGDDNESAVELGDIDVDAPIADNQHEARHDDQIGDIDRGISLLSIRLMAYSPLPTLRLLLIEAHTQERPDQIPRQEDNVDQQVNDLEAGVTSASPPDAFASASQPSRRDLLINNLPLAVQMAFRQNVLRALFIYVSILAALVVGCCLLIRSSEVHEVLELSGWFRIVCLMAAWLASLASTGLLHTVRFEYPANIVVLCFITVFQVIGIVVWASDTESTLVIVASSLAVSSTMLQIGFSTHVLQRNGESSLIHPFGAALLTAALVSAVSIALNLVLGVEVTSVTTEDLVPVLIALTCGLLWIGAVLATLCQSLTPDEHTRAIVFFHSDLVVVFLLFPLRGVAKLLRPVLPPIVSRGEKALKSPKHSDVVAVIPIESDDVELRASQPPTEMLSLPTVTARSPRGLVISPPYPSQLRPERFNSAAAVDRPRAWSSAVASHHNTTAPSPRRRSTIAEA
ncbi:hypothetical protein PINS_up013205 [Pythium insidiosum]|nr:hypothetical protein PINS_up013205 [Pythium insidiosum]